MKTTKRSPLKAKPLRNPGQSLDEQIDDLKYDKMLNHLLIAVVSLLLIFLEWYRWLTDMPVQPVVITLTVLPIIIYCAIRIRLSYNKLQRLKLGRDGEKVVGQYLEQVKDAGDRVFHDIVGNGFNLDHVIVSQHGIFIIETKTYSKPSTGKPKIYFDGSTIKINNEIIANQLIDQVRAQQAWLKEVLRESTGRKFPVMPVIVFPGWFVEATKSSFSSGLWVLNAKGLPSFIHNTPVKLSPEDKQLAAYHLSGYIRTSY
jgi:hypothetical protein